MAQEPCIGVYKPCINLPFGDCAMYFDHGVIAYNLNLNKVAADSFFTWTVCTDLGETQRPIQGLSSSKSGCLAAEVEWILNQRLLLQAISSAWKGNYEKAKVQSPLIILPRTNEVVSNRLGWQHLLQRLSQPLPQALETSDSQSLLYYRTHPGSYDIFYSMNTGMQHTTMQYGNIAGI